MHTIRKRLLPFSLCCFMALSYIVSPALAATEKTAAVSGTVAGADGSGLIAQVLVTGEDYQTRINTDMLGRFSLRLPLGEYQIELSKGSEYERSIVPVSVADRRAQYLGILTLQRLYQTDWLAGDLHQHSVYSFDGRNSPAEIVLSDLAMGLSFGVLTDHNDLRGNPEYASATLNGFIPIMGMEITTDRGHFNAIHFNADLDVSVQNGESDVRRIVQAVHTVPGALLQINHPTRTEFAFVDTQLTSLFDVYELWNGKRAAPYVEGEPNFQAVQTWFDMLADGLYLPATAGSDNHDINGNLLFVSPDELSDDGRWYMTAMFSGMPRLYVFAPERTADAVLRAIGAGNSFLTNNPLAFVDVDGAIPGQTTSAGDCQVGVTLQSNRPLLSYTLIVNGVAQVHVSIDGLTFTDTHTLPLHAGDWVVLTVRGVNGDYAISNPVFIK